MINDLVTFSPIPELKFFGNCTRCNTNLDTRAQTNYRTNAEKILLEEFSHCNISIETAMKCLGSFTVFLIRFDLMTEYHNNKRICQACVDADKLVPIEDGVMETHYKIFSQYLQFGKERLLNYLAGGVFCIDDYTAEDDNVYRKFINGKKLPGKIINEDSSVRKLYV